MSEWRERRQGASFRGAPFWLEEDSVSVGRRTQTHEFPQRDEACIEDLGRRTREYKFRGFVVGDHCLSQRDELLGALDTPGPGELVHPWFGRLLVTPGECEVSHARNELGVVRFSLSFKAGMLSFPTQEVNSRRLLAKQAPNFLESAKARFNSAMDTVDLARQRVNAVRSAVSKAHAFGIGFLKPLTNFSGDLDALVYSILNTPRAFSASLLSDVHSLERTFSGYGAHGSFTGTAEKAIAVSALPKSAPPVAPGDVAVIQAAVVGLVQDAALLDLLLDAAKIPIADAQGFSEPASLDVQLAELGATREAGSSTASSVPISEDVLEVRDAISSAFWAVAASSRPEHFGVLSSARLALDRHLTEVARSGVGLRIFLPAETTSSLVLAHRLYADARRSGEIISRNRVRHPGFLPALELKLAKK